MVIVEISLKVWLFLEDFLLGGLGGLAEAEVEAEGAVRLKAEKTCGGLL